jgi:DNA-binding CsgD family transcriptional regulator
LAGIAGLLVFTPLVAHALKATATNIASIDLMQFIGFVLLCAQCIQLTPFMVPPLQRSEFLDKQNISHVAAAMYLSDPERTTPIDPETLSATFELTPKEAAVAVALANGLSVEEVSKTNGTTLNTIRTQLKAIFRKTGTRRQTELVRLLLSGPFMA